MASSTPINQANSDLIAELYALSAQKPKLVKSSVYNAPADPSRTIRSWKMDEFKYYNVPSPFPTLARGLFTEKVEGGEDKKGAPAANDRFRIVVRGYDKFFNIGEVPWTTWAALEKYTAPPYVLTLKSNGCIIFIAALSPTKLLITSKHSLGPVSGVSVSHAQRGEYWLEKHLEKIGKTKEELAGKLWETKWTAIAELCDDSFEEHVLPYAEDKTGLHLHGLNESTKGFHTEPTETVDAFAADWGFIPTRSTVLKTVSEVKAFTDEVGKTGMWDGEALEGFVVRSHVAGPRSKSPGGEAEAGTEGDATESRPPGEPSTSTRLPRDHPPYPAGSSFFFKVKFDEPYMMYRDWREITRSLLSHHDKSGGKSPILSAKVPKSKLKRKESNVYMKWVAREIEKDPRAFAEFGKGKGIIRTRERFLKWMETGEGKEGLEGVEEGAEEDAKTVFKTDDGRKTIIVPIAIPGCGKTAIAVALAHLFGFGHTQSDDVRQKKAAPVFLKNVADLLKTHDVVIADKNNHLRQHRADLRKVTSHLRQSPRLVALNWSFDLPLATIHRICAERVSRRGSNHQSLHADIKTKAHEDVIWMFLKGTEELAQTEVDAIIEMDITESQEQALDRAVDGVCRVLGLEKPDQEKIGEALALAREYEPSTKTNVHNNQTMVARTGKKGKGKGGKEGPRYFAFLPEIDAGRVVEERMLGDDVPQTFRDFWIALRAKDRVVVRPHVTIVHQKSLPDQVELWERCVALHEGESAPLFEFKLSHIVADKNLAALVVGDVALAKVEEGEEASQEGAAFVSMMPHEVRERLHITLGTRNPGIAPVLAKDLVEKWRAGKAGEDVVVIPLENVTAKGVVKGLIS